MASSDNLSEQDKQFLGSCEEELKDRYTENDEAFMRVFNADPSTPPIIESWWVPNNSGRRNDRRFNRRSHPYSRGGPRPDARGRYDHSRQHDDRGRYDHSRQHDDRGRYDHSRQHDDRGNAHHSNRRNY